MGWILLSENLSQNQVVEAESRLFRVARYRTCTDSKSVLGISQLRGDQFNVTVFHT